MGMTSQEAIKRITDHMEVHHIGEPPHIHIGEALLMAITALREKAEREDPKPLTVEELLRMDGEPVWLDRAGGIYGLVDVPDRVVWLDRGGCHAIGNLEGIAYRHKPKEV